MVSRFGRTGVLTRTSKEGASSDALPIFSFGQFTSIFFEGVSNKLIETVKIFWSLALSGGALRPEMALRECKS